MPSKKSDTTATPSSVELLELLRAAIDGIDGYEAENGYLRYWKAESIDRARRLLDSVDEKTDPRNRDDA